MIYRMAPIGVGCFAIIAGLAFFEIRAPLLTLLCLIGFGLLAFFGAFVLGGFLSVVLYFIGYWAPRATLAAQRLDAWLEEEV